ncbi:probable methyltransferase-like protein 24 [Procambarus clarkii]|uniref:probable methyltransferase-like protein 24 n=1 Tax=Procambarus clarkii TaxID=6728 RepID=UPI003743661A
MTSRIITTVSMGVIMIVICLCLLSMSHQSRKTRFRRHVGRKCFIKPLRSVSEFYHYFEKIEYKCNSLKPFGMRPLREDGAKFVCLDEKFGLKRNACTVLSFGVNYEWEFEDDMDDYGCKVYAFDPTMQTQNDNKRSERISFYRLGIGDIQGTRNVGMGQDFDYFKVDRYENILHMLGLQDARVDYLKMDVELSELEFLRDVLRNNPHYLTNVGQIAMEIHHGYNGEGLDQKPPRVGPLSPTSTLPLFWSHFQELRCLGFRLVHARENSPWHEVLWARADHW